MLENKYIPQSVLQSPAFDEQSSKDLNNLGRITDLTEFNELVQKETDQTFTELHQNRIKSLRKELKFLKETEWMYEHLNKNIRQN